MKKQCFQLIATLVFALCLVPDPGWSASYKEISAPVVKDMLERKNVLVINVMSSLEYDLHHITGSINIPLNTLETTRQLPTDLTTPFIFHCMGFR